MSDRRSSEEAIDILFSMLADLVKKDPRAQRRLLDAIGAPIEFVGKEAVQAIDPVFLVDRGEEEFRRQLLTFTLAQVKKIAVDHNLAAATEFKGLKLGNAVELVWNRALRKRNDMRPRSAAE